MPKPSKKQGKSKEEKLAENFFPVDEDDVKYSVEKPHKKLDINQLEKIIGKISKKKTSYRKKYSKKTTKKTTKRSYKKSSKKYRTNNIEFKIPDIKLKKNGPELIITEKPQAAAKIAEALGKPKKQNLKGVAYYEVNRDGRQLLVACAVGHLFTLKQTITGYENPVFEIKWVPNYIAKKGDFTKKYYDVILNLVKKAGSITIATDYDVEGEVIGLNIVKYICNQPDANRMKFSTLTPNELNESYDNKLKSIDWGQAIAGETRHYLDWFYGINLSRALMNAIKTTGRFKIMSIGRVQGPTLNLIVNKERKIQAFEPKPYWQIFIKIFDSKTKKEIELKHNKDIFDKSLLKQFEKLKGQKAEAKTKKTLEKIPPNPPFNLTTLQTEAYRLHGITPAETLRIAQSLYLNGLISYPRTSSQKLPASINYKNILKQLAQEFKAEDLIKRDKPVEGKKSDPAHPSIYPTGQKMILSGSEEKLYNLIVKRFLSLFCEDAEIEKKNISLEINKLKFSTKGEEIKKQSWLRIYPTSIKEKDIPDIDGEVEIKDIRFEEKETQPPKRYTPGSIVSELEKRNLGTKATRSSILETLYDRNYVREKSIEATELGMSLIKTLEKYSHIIIDENLTREFEKEMESIRQSKKSPYEKQKKVIEKAKELIKKIFDDFEKHKEKIGKELLNANIQQIEHQKIENRIMTCPKCQKGHLIINYSKKTKRQFVSCDAYPDCTNTYSLPPNSLIKKTDNVCEECNFPKLMSLRKGKKPWIFCFNPECPTN
ncbi:MAG: DNA topoisomerase I, partial [Minisyncoccales bacterium]